MGSHYSALLLMDFLQEIDVATVVENLLQQKYELASEETYYPAMHLESRSVSVSKFNNFLFVQGEVLFGRENETELMQCLKQLSTRSSIFHWTVEDTSGALSFDYLENGISKRSWWSCDGRVTLNHGERLVNEPPGKFVNSLAQEDEWDVVAIAEVFGFIWDELEETRCTIYRPAQVERLSRSVTRQKPWWKFWL